MLATQNLVGDPTWYIDSRASHHLTNDHHTLSLHSDYTNGDGVIVIGNGMMLPISHVGYTKLSNSLVLSNVYHTRAITKKFLSVFQFTDDNNVILEFHHTRCFVNCRAKIILKGVLDHGLYKIPVNQTFSKLMALIGERNSLQGWHNRLGYPSSGIIRKMVTDFHLPLSNKNLDSVCV